MVMTDKEIKTPHRIRVLGVPVDCVNMAQALDAVDAMIKGGKAGTIFAVNPEKVMKAREDSVLMGYLESAGLLIPDGIGVVFAARFLGLGSMQRVPGSELMPAICERARDRGYKIFLFGASPEVNESVAKILPERYPGIAIVGRQHGYFAAEEMPDVINRINTSGAQILFVALGSPKQEEWMACYLPELKVRVCQGVGGTFDVIAGKVNRAPTFFLKLHLEWFYRLVSDPRRMKRQTALPRFAWCVICEKFRGR